MSQSFKMDEQTFKKERNNDGQYMIMAFMFQCLFGPRATDGFCLTSFSFFFLFSLGPRSQRSDNGMGKLGVNHMTECWLASLCMHGGLWHGEGEGRKGRRTERQARLLRVLFKTFHLLTKCTE